MNKWLVFFALICALSLSACIYNRERPYADPQELIKEKNPLVESSYTLMEVVVINEKKVGYILTYLEVPAYSKEEPFTQPDLKMIFDLDFNYVGFITPYGETYRYVEGSDKSERVCQFNLEKNLAYFFGFPMGEVEIQDLKS